MDRDNFGVTGGYRSFDQADFTTAHIAHIWTRGRFSDCDHGARAWPDGQCTAEGSLGTPAANRRDAIWRGPTACRLVGPARPLSGNCAFVSGDVAGAFWTIAPAALAPPQWRVPPMARRSARDWYGGNSCDGWRPFPIRCHLCRRLHVSGHLVCLRSDLSMAPYASLGPRRRTFY